MSYGGYRNRRPNTRRNRRASRPSKRSRPQGTDKMFFLGAGLFLVVIMLILAALALSTG